MTKINKFLSKKAQKKVIEAIKIAEKNTSGEIRVHIEKNYDGNNPERTLEIFKQLKMYETKDRNAILFHINLQSKTLSIYGDKAIHEQVSQQFWDDLHQKIMIHFKNQKYKKGLIKGILETGEKLKNYFPFQDDDKNELNDEISFS